MTVAARQAPYAPAIPQLRPYQADLVEKVRQAFREGKRCPMVVLSTGGGKCHGKDTPIMMYDGTVKMVQDVQVGDRLMGPDSKPRRVLSLARGREMLYRVTPVKGDPYVVNESHILSLRRTNSSSNPRYPSQARGGQIVNICVRDYLQSSTSFKHLHKGWRAAVDFQPAGKLPVPAYVIGAWLGDGTTGKLSFTTGDSEIAAEFAKYAKSVGMEFTVEQNSDWSVQVHMKSSGVRYGRGGSPFGNALRDLGIFNEKRIPHSYKTASRRDRLELLAGIIDTDGHYGGKGFDLTLKSECLMDDVIFLARSLGFACYKRAVRKKCYNNGTVGTYFQCHINGPLEEVPCRLQRKMAKPRQQKKNVLNVGISVEAIGEGDYYGFAIDGDHLYLLGDFTVTHNTMIFSHIAHSTAERDNAVLIAAHRKEIIRQISLSLARFGVEHQVIAPPDKVRAIKIAHYRAFGRSFVNQHSTTMVGSVQTIVGRFKDIDATVDKLAARLGRKARMLVVMDEAHHVVQGTQWGQVMDRYVEGTRYDALGLLVTASPKRLDGTGLGKGHGGYADCLIEGPSMKWLMGQGFLSDYVIYGTPYGIDTTGVGHRMGEFITKELEERTDKQAIRDDTVRLYREHAWGMRAVAFCASVKASKNLADTLNRAGIPAAHIDGEVDDDVRDQAIIDFATGKLWVLTQVNLVSEGFDLASIAQMDVTIDCVIDVAPTESLVNFMQRGGRMLRPAPGKVGVYLDQAGNFDKHGTLEMERAWSLEGGKKGNSAANDNGEPEVSIITCTTCYAKFDYAKATAAGQLKADRMGLPDSRPCCPVCQTDVVAKERKVKHEVDQQLVLKNKAELEEQHRQLRREELRQQGQAQTLEELLAQGKPLKQAEAILKAREEKAQLYELLRQTIREWHQRHRLPVKTVFNVYTQDIDRMKPKQMRELLAKVQADDRQRREAAGELFPEETEPAFSIAPVA